VCAPGLPRWPFQGPGAIGRARAGPAVTVASALAWALVGCGVGARPALDAGMERDAALVEGGLVRPDAGEAQDAGGADAGAALDASVFACAAGDCELGGACGDAGTCALRDRTPACSEADGALPEGAPCEGDGTCSAGLSCFRDVRGAGSAAGVCAFPCCPGISDACGAGRRCSADGVLASGITTTWGRCDAERACDLRMPLCAEREGCYLDPATGRSDCRLAGNVGDGGACVRPEDCAPGRVCAGLGLTTCAPLCVLGDADGCVEGACVAQAYTPSGLGVCVAPARG